jgi:hypothetical protein
VFYGLLIKLLIHPKKKKEDTFSALISSNTSHNSVKNRNPNSYTKIFTHFSGQPNKHIKRPNPKPPTTQEETEKKKTQKEKKNPQILLPPPPPMRGVLRERNDLRERRGQRGRQRRVPAKRARAVQLQPGVEVCGCCGGGGGCCWGHWESGGSRNRDRRRGGRWRM